MIRIAILDDYQGVALDYADWSSLGPEARVESFREHIAQADELAARLHDFECVVLMRERTPFPRALIERLPALKLIIRLGNGGTIDLAAAAERGALVCGTESLGYVAAEQTWALILAAARNIPREDAALRRGRWQTSVGRGLHGKTLGILGLGRVGSQVAAIGTAFGMEVIAWSPSLTAARATAQGALRVDKEVLFERADVLSVHVVLGDRTRGLVGAAELARMKKTAYLINTARGPIVQEEALIEALRTHRIAGAALDVFDVEPIRGDHPLLRLENVVLSPHFGYVIEEIYRQSYEQALENIRAFIDGKPIRVITAGK